MMALGCSMDSVLFRRGIAMSEAIKVDSAEVFQALQKQTTPVEYDTRMALIRKLFETIGKHLAAGERLAFLKSKADGTVELTVIDVEVLGKDQSRTIASHHLNILFPLPALLSIDDFFYGIRSASNAIDIIYSIYALVFSGSLNTISQFADYVSKQPNTESLDNRVLYGYLDAAAVKPLRIVSFHYGSPASVDLLGIGKVLEVLKDSIKDLVWRGTHERAMAELEQEEKKLGITNNELQSHEKLADIALKKLEIIEKAINLELPDSDKRLIIMALLPQMQALADAPVVPLLEASESPHATIGSNG
jgi:hypothetical protein